MATLHPHRSDELYRVLITCRCEARFTALISKKLDIPTAHPCTGCGAVYAIDVTAPGKFKVRRMAQGEPLGNRKMVRYHFNENQLPKKGETHSGHKVGQEVLILDSLNSQWQNKRGFISKVVRIQGVYCPIITLHDGTEVGGWECWWAPVEEAGLEPEVKKHVN